MEDFDIDFEENYEGPFIRHVISGCMAGQAEHITLFPMDTIKTNMQVNSQSKSIQKTFKSLTQTSQQRLFRGVSATAIACGPAHALHFSLQEAVKIRSEQQRQPLLRDVGLAMAGISASLGHDLVMVPLDVVKQRMQLCDKSQRSSLPNIVKCVYKEAGIRGFYRSLLITLSMNAPQSSLFVLLNEKIKYFLKSNAFQASKDNSFSVGFYLSAAGISSGISSFIMNPLDVVKTRLQTQGWATLDTNLGAKCTNDGTNICSSSSLNNDDFKSKTNSNSQNENKTKINNVSKRSFSSVNNNNSQGSRQIEYDELLQNNQKDKNKIQQENIRHTIKSIQRNEGLFMFQRGATARMLQNIPSVAISWVTQEQFKDKLKTQGV